MRKNKKHLIGLGLLLLASTIISGQTEAATNFGTISIANPDNPSEGFTIMDRNLGATSNDIENPGSYGYYYQWGNNYGFPSSKEVKKISADQVDASNYGPGNYYENDTFIIWNDNWDSSNNNNLWGGANDNENNGRGVEINNPKDRQGPCPQGYHIPSLGEWLLLVKYWADTNNKAYNYYPERGVLELNRGYSEFRNYFKIPLAGEYYLSGDNSNWLNYMGGEDYEYDSVLIRFQGNQSNPSSHYRTSSPAINSSSPDNARSFYMDDIFYFYVGNTDSRNRTSSIRCFKNTYEKATTTDKVTSTDNQQNINTEDSKQLNGNLINNIKKTVEFNSYEVNKKVVFSGTFTALKDTTINYYGIDTTYDESKGNKYIDKRCEKNKTDMKFYVYIDGKLIDTTPINDTCHLGQGAGFGKWINQISLKKGQSKDIKVEIEMSGSVQEEDTYKFSLLLNNAEKNTREYEKGSVKADFTIKILNNDKDSIISKTQEENQKISRIIIDQEADGNPSKILNNGYSKEMNDAYKYAHNNGITTTNDIEKAKMNSPLTRIAMAKMLSYYAINVLGQKPNTSKGTPVFNDVTSNLNSQYNNAVTLAYQLGIMGQNMKNNNFRPNDEVTRAEFATALSRMLYGTSDGSPYYTTHLNKLKQEEIITNDNPKLKEKRGYVMLMLMRAAE